MKETFEILVNLMCIYNQSEKLLKLILRQEFYNTSPRPFWSSLVNAVWTFFSKYIYFSRIVSLKRLLMSEAGVISSLFWWIQKKIWMFFFFLKVLFYRQGKQNVLLQTGGCFLLAYVVTNNYTVAYFSIVFDICVFYNFRIIQIAATIGISLTGSWIIDARFFLLLMKCL